MDIGVIVYTTELEAPSLRETARRILEAEAARFGVPLGRAEVLHRRARGGSPMHVMAAADELVLVRRREQSPANSASPRHWTRPRRAWPEVPGPCQVPASEQPGPAPLATPSARRAKSQPPGRGRGGPEVHPSPGPLRPGPGLLPRPEASRNSQIDEDDARIDPPELSLPWRRGTAARSCQSAVKAAAGFGTLVAKSQNRPSGCAGPRRY